MRGGKFPSIISRNTQSNYILLSGSKPRNSLIWLHGLGGQAEHYVSFFSHSDSAVYNGCRIRLLQAPKRFTTISQQQAYSWYDIRSLKRFTEPEEKVFNMDHIKESRAIIQKHVEEEVAFWKENQPQSKLQPTKRIYVGGMSQGGVMSLSFGLSASAVPAGVICFSGYLLRSAPTANLATLPLLLVHGHRDATIREVEARNSYKLLLEDKERTEYHTIKKLDHSVCLEQIGLIKMWIEKTHQKHQQKVVL